MLRGASPCHVAIIEAICSSMERTADSYYHDAALRHDEDAARPEWQLFLAEPVSGPSSLGPKTAGPHAPTCRYSRWSRSILKAAITGYALPPASHA